MEFGGEIRFTKQEQEWLDHWKNLMKKRDAAQDKYRQSLQELSPAMQHSGNRDWGESNKAAFAAWEKARKEEEDFIRGHWDLREKWLKSMDKNKPAAVEMSYLPLPEDARSVARDTSQSLFNKVYVAPVGDAKELAKTEDALRTAQKSIRADAPKPPDGEPPQSRLKKVEAWMKANEPRMKEIAELQNKRYRLSNQAAGQVRKLSDGRKVVYLTREGLRTISNAQTDTYEPNYGLQGTTIPKQAVDPIVDVIRESASPIADIVAELIAKGKNEDGSVTVSFIPGDNEPINDILSVLREELSHAWQLGLSETHEMSKILDHSQWETLYEHVPAGMKKYLARNQYAMGNKPQIVSEASAKLMGFAPSEFGMTPTEAANFLYEYLDAIVKRHGAKALDQLVHINKFTREMKEHFTHGEQQVPNRSADQGNVRGIPEGRQGGSAQAYASQGSGSGPTEAERGKLDQLRNIAARNDYNERANKDIRDYLRTNGFTESGANTDPTKTIVYTRYNDVGDGDVNHTVVVYPSGEWEYTSESNRGGVGLGSLSTLQLEPKTITKSEWPGVSFNRKVDALRLATAKLKGVIH